MRWMTALLFLAPQDVKLQPKAAVGEKATVSVESALDMEVTVRDGDGESIRFLSVVRREKFVQEVTRVDGGMPAALTLQCLASTLQKSGTNLALGTAATPLAGKTFVGTRSEHGWVVKDADGKPAPVEGQTLGSWNDYVRLLPKGAVRADDAWKVDGRGLGDLFFPPGTTDVAGSLECSLESLAGGRAVILIRGSVEGRGKDDSIKALTLSGSRLVFDTRNGKPLSLAVNGSLETRRDVTESYSKPGSQKDERRQAGEIVYKSRKLEVSFVFE